MKNFINIRYFLYAFYIFILLISTFPSKLYADKYAVLIECDPAPLSGFNEFWNDTFLMYEYLIDHDFNPDNIYVLFYDGNDWPSPNPRYQPGSIMNPHIAGPITDYDASLKALTHVCDLLRKKMTRKDFLFVWTFDHGFGSGCNANLCLYGSPSYINDTDFAALFNKIPYSCRVFCMQQCHSGGFVDNLENKNTIVLTATHCDYSAFPADNWPTPESETFGGITYRHGEFNFHLISALRWLTAADDPVKADITPNKTISIQDAAGWIINNDSKYEETQWSDLGSKGDRIAMGSTKSIGNNTDVFIRDHDFEMVSGRNRAPDDGSGISNRHGERYWVSPDILIDCDNDGSPDPNPKIGNDNWLYCNIHNINHKSSPFDTAKFFWADASIVVPPWPSSNWHYIGSKTIAAPTSMTVTTPHFRNDHLSWYPPFKPGLHCCLLVRIESPRDKMDVVDPSPWIYIPQNNNIALRNTTLILNYAILKETPLKIFWPKNQKAEKILLSSSEIPRDWRVIVQLEQGGKKIVINGEEGMIEQPAIIRMKPGEVREIYLSIIPGIMNYPTDINIIASIWNPISKEKSEIIGGYTISYR